MFSYSTFKERYVNTGKRMFWVMNALGLTPYDPLIPPKLRYVPITYSLILILWYSLQVFWCFKAIYNMPNLSVFPVIVVFQKFSQCIIPISVITETLLDKGCAMKDLFDCAIYTDQCFGMIGVSVNMTKMKHFVDQMFLYVTAYSIMLLGSAVFLFMKLAETSAFYAFSLSTFHLSHLIYSNYLTYYICVLVGCFRYRFKYVNDEFKTMLKTQFDDYKHMVILVKAYHVDEVAKIKTLKCIHAVYRDIVNDHNRRVSVVMTLQILQGIITVILSAYFLICMLLNFIDTQDLGKYLVAIFLINIIQCFGMTICFAVICFSKTNAEANYTEYLVHKLMSETTNREAIKQLEEFSLELVHCKVEFKSCEYFPLDFTLFTTIIGAVISYVIILIQFGKFDFNELVSFIKNESLPRNV